MKVLLIISKILNQIIIIYKSQVYLIRKRMIQKGTLTVPLFGLSWNIYQLQIRG